MRRLETWKPRKPVAVVYASPRASSIVNGRTPGLSGPILRTTLFVAVDATTRKRELRGPR